MKKTVDRLALERVCSWMAQSGFCTHYPGYLCDKEFTRDGVCARCIRDYFLRMIRKEMREGKIK